MHSGVATPPPHAERSKLPSANAVDVCRPASQESHLWQPSWKGARSKTSGGAHHVVRSRVTWDL